MNSWQLSQWPQDAKGLADPAFSVGKASLSPSHAIPGTHTFSGLTAGHVLRASSATTAVFATLQASDIADGSVSNTEFQYLDGVTGAIQTALDAKMPLAGGTFTGDVTLSGVTKLEVGDAGQYIYESAATILSYVSAGRHEFTGGPVYVGTGTPGHTITGSGDLFVADRIEVDGEALFDGTMRAYSNLYLYTSLWLCHSATQLIVFESGYFGKIQTEPDDGLHWAFWGGTADKMNRNLIFVDFSAAGDDYDHSSISAHPTLIWHSSTRAATATDEWMSLSFPTTHALLAVGSGWFEITPDILSPSSAKHYFDVGASQGTEHITSGADTYLDLYHGAGGGMRVYDENNLLLTVRRYDGSFPTFTVLDAPVYIDLSIAGTRKWYVTATAMQSLVDFQLFSVSKLVVRAATEYIQSTDAGHLDFYAGTSIDLNADTVVAAGKDLDCATSGGYLKPRRLRQSAQPTPDAGELLVWCDEDDDSVHLVYNDANGGVAQFDEV